MIGTGSVRAGLISISDGRLVVSYSQSNCLSKWHHHLEQSAMIFGIVVIL
jgi:hypothetical protein